MNRRRVFAIGSITFLLFLMIFAEAHHSSAAPAQLATAAATTAATGNATATSTTAPSATPTHLPSATPTALPSATPTTPPTATPTTLPSATPTITPSATPTETATELPTDIPTATPPLALTPIPSATPLTPTIKVNTNSDEIDDCTGTCSLRGAIASVKRGDVIGFESNITGVLSLDAALQIEKDVVIVGPGQDVLALDVHNKDHVFFVKQGHTASISGLTLQNGLDNQFGGAIINLGTLTVINCTITGSSAGKVGYGGGIANGGTLTLKGSTITKNSAFAGGGIDNSQSGKLTIIDSTISDNSADGLDNPYGGGISNDGTLTITNSTIANNTVTGAHSFGGGIANFGTATITADAITGNSTEHEGGGVMNGGTLTITNSTLSKNSSTAGAAIFAQRPLTIISSTLSDNTATVLGGGIFMFQGGLTIGSSIIAGNTVTDSGGKGPDIYLNTGASLTSRGFNLIGEGEGLKTLAKTDQHNVDPMLDALTVNAPGTTASMALQAGSPAIGKGGTKCPVIDQRGVKRKKTCDVGAYETTS